MRESDLSSPGIGGKGYHLRRVLAAAISQLQVNAGAFGNDRHPGSTALDAMLVEARTAVGLLLPVAPVLAFTPSAKSFTVAAGPTAGPALNTGGSDGAVSYGSATPGVATVNATTGVITAVSVGTSVITATIVAYGGYLGTTHPYTATVTA